MTKKLIIAILIITALAFVYYANAIEITPQELQELQEQNLGATILHVYQGGTGATSFTSGECVVGNGTGALTTTACGGAGGTGSNWEYTTHYAVDVLTPSTTIPVWFKDAVYASSTIYGALTGNADTATAFAGNPAGHCGAGEYGLGIDANGEMESCTDATTEIDTAISTHSGDDDAHHALVTITGQDYLTLSTQQITMGEIEPDDLAASDFGEFTCNGTTCVLEATNTTLTTLANVTDIGTITDLAATNASTTAFSTSYASSTQYFGADLQTCNATTGKLTWADGVFACGTDFNTGGGGSSAFWASSTELAFYPLDITDVVIFGDNATTSEGYIFEVIGDTLMDGLKMSGDFEVSTNGSSEATPRTGSFVDLSSNEYARFQFGDEHNAFQNGYAKDMQVYSYWSLILMGGRQNVGTGFSAPHFSKTLDVGVLVKSDTAGVGSDGGSSGNPITTLGIMATTSQWANLTAWMDSAETVLSSVDYLGHFSLGTTATSSSVLNVVGETTMGNLTSDGTIEGATLTEGGQAVFNTTEAATFTGLTSSGTVNLDDGSGSSPILYIIDEDNETMGLSKNDAGFSVISNSEGAIRIEPSGDVDDYLYVSTAAGIITLTTQAGDNGDLVITSGGGEISFGDENLTTTGKLGLTGTRVLEGWFDDLESTNDITVGGTALASIYSPIAGSASILTVGALDTGSITSGFTSIDVGDGAISTTGLLTATNASTTALSTVYASSTEGWFGELYLQNLGTAAGAFLAVDATGLVIATTTPTGGGDADQNLWKTIEGDSGSTAADSTTDTLTIAGATSLTTIMAADTLTIYIDDDVMTWTEASSTITTLGIISAGTWEATDIAVAHGGTGASALDDGFLLLGNATAAIQTLDLTTAGAIVIGDGTTDPTTLNAFSSATGILDETYGGTGLADPTDHALIVGSGAAAMTELAVGTDGQILVGDSANDPVWATFTAGDSLTATIGAGTLEIDVDDDFIKLVGDAGMTGNFDFSGAQLELPQNQTATLVGQIDFDTTDNQIQIATSTDDGVAVIPTMIKLFGGGLASTSPDFISGGRQFTTPQRDGFVVREIHCIVDGGTSVVINLSNIAGTTDSETVTCDADGAVDTSIDTNSVYASGSYNSIEYGTVTGVIDTVVWSVWGHILPE